MSRKLIFAAALIFVFGAVSTASARPPHKPQRYDQVARPGADHSYHMRTQPRAYKAHHKAYRVQTTKMPRQLQKWRQKGEIWDATPSVNLPRKVWLTKRANNKPMDPKVESMLNRRMQQRANCSHGDCGSINKHRAKRTDRVRKDKNRNVRRPYGHTSRPATKPDKIYVDPRTKARFKKLKKMIMPDAEGCIDAAECMI